MRDQGGLDYTQGERSMRIKSHFTQNYSKLLKTSCEGFERMVRQWIGWLTLLLKTPNTEVLSVLRVLRLISHFQSFLSYISQLLLPFYGYALKTLKTSFARVLWPPAPSSTIPLSPIALRGAYILRAQESGGLKVLTRLSRAPLLF